jgi:hypothetical protein
MKVPGLELCYSTEQETAEMEKMHDHHYLAFGPFCVEKVIC